MKTGTQPITEHDLVNLDGTSKPHAFQPSGEGAFCVCGWVKDSPEGNHVPSQGTPAQGQFRVKVRGPILVDGWERYEVVREDRNRWDVGGVLASTTKEYAELIATLINRDPAFQRLVEAAQAVVDCAGMGETPIKFTAHVLPLIDDLDEALRLARGEIKR